jgi:hypothetical protein
LVRRDIRLSRVGSRLARREGGLQRGEGPLRCIQRGSARSPESGAIHRRGSSGGGETYVVGERRLAARQGASPSRGSDASGGLAALAARESPSARRQSAPPRVTEGSVFTTTGFVDATEGLAVSSGPSVGPSGRDFRTADTFDRAAGVLRRAERPVCRSAKSLPLAAEVVCRSGGPFPLGAGPVCRSAEAMCHAAEAVCRAAEALSHAGEAVCRVAETLSRAAEAVCQADGPPTHGAEAVCRAVRPPSSGRASPCMRGCPLWTHAWPLCMTWALHRTPRHVKPESHGHS